MPEGDALDEMCLPTLSQKVHRDEDEGPLPSESTSINEGCGRYGLSSSSSLGLPGHVSHTFLLKLLHFASVVTWLEKKRANIRQLQ